MRPRIDKVVAGKVATGLLTVVALVIVAGQFGKFYPLGDWLIWRYLGIWSLVAVWALACLSAGHALLRRLRPTPLPLREHALYAFACGVLIFMTAVFLVGLFGGFGPVAFVGVPIVLIGTGARSLLDLARRARAKILAARLRPEARRPSAAAYLMFGCGAICVVALYLNILTPANLAYDVHWYHMGEAEHYAATHAIRRFPEGWFAGALPQLASLLYTWAFLLPGSDLFMRIELAAHLEFAIFIATLASIPLLVRWLTNGARHTQSWVALFLFPGIFVYDSSVSGAADHVLAFWAVPLFLALARLWRTWRRTDACLLALMAGGAALTKYQSLYMLVPVAVAIGVRIALAVWRARALRPALAAPAAGAGLFAAVTAVHWLKNLIWYGDPMYPLLHGVLHLRPWNPDADPVTTLQSGGFKPTGPFAQRLLDSTQALVTFPFHAYDWPNFHRDWPTFGFLFTVMLPFLLIVRKAERLRALAAAALGGVFVWHWTFHEIRYLQSLVPWMAALVAALFVRLWQTGLVARLSVASLCAMQIALGSDQYFWPVHAMAGHPLRASMDLIASGFERRVASRFQVSSNLAGAGKTLGPDARVLIHEQHLRLGIGVPAMGDARGTQGALSYRRARSPRDLWQRLRDLGVTHLLWLGAPMGIEAYGDEAVFYDFVARYVGPPRRIDGVVLAPMSPTPPPDVPYQAVALQGCQLAGRVPMSEVDTAIWIATPPPSAEQMAANQRDVDFIILEGACRARFPPRGDFDLVTARNGWETWSRRR